MRLSIYSKDTREAVALITEYTYVTYTQELKGPGSFEIRMPDTEKSLEFLVFGNYINFEYGVMGIVKGRRDSESSDSEVIVYGYLSNHILEYRSFLVTHKYYDYINKIVNSMMMDLFTDPIDERRKISFITRQGTGNNIGNKVRVQNTGDTLLQVLSDILEPYSLGFVLFPWYSEPYLNNVQFQLIRPVDRSVDNSDGNDPVVFSFDLDNLQKFEYEDDGRQYCNIAVVASEGEGLDRKIIEVGNEEAVGIDRIELYVDARDLQSSVTEEWVEDYVDDQFGELLNGEY